MESTERKSRRHDPERRERIIDAALDVIEKHGVAGTTHRRVAEEADVPLGSMTYHFEGMEQLLNAAFTKLASTISSHYMEVLSSARTRDEACRAVVGIICGDVWPSRRTLLLSYELYAYTIRNPESMPVMRDWIDQSRRALSRHFDAPTSRALDALIEGIGIHNSTATTPMNRREVEAVVKTVASMSGVAKR